MPPVHMQFDVRTLLVAVALSTAFCAMARFLLMRLHPTMPGLGRWAWASVLASVALGVLAFRDTHAGDLAVSTAQVLMSIGMMVVWDGFRAFIGLPRVRTGILVALGVAILVPIALSQIGQSMPLRSASNAFMVSTLSALIAHDLLANAARHQLAMRATGWIYAANSAFFLVRMVGVVRAPEPLDVALSSGFIAISLFWWLCTSLAVTLGMTMMASERLQADLDQQASRDPLTGALNRRAFALVSEKVVARSRRDLQPVSLLMMDLDHFKQINDHLGHAAGDAMLRLFVAVAERVLRAEDVFCRHGGEEFVALLPGSSSGQAMAAAERLRSTFAEAAANDSLTQPLPFMATVSLGVTQMLADEELEEALNRADEALYRAKHCGRNRSELALQEAVA